MANISEINSGINIHNPMSLVTLTVTIPKAMKLRMRIAEVLMRMAAMVMGCGIKVVTESAPLPTPPRRRPF